MKIIGGKDYYDSGLAYGRDENLIFVRSSVSITEHPFSYHTYDYNKEFSRWLNENDLKVQKYHVYFCGKCYHGIEFFNIMTTPLPNIFWDYDSLLKKFDDPEILKGFTKYFVPSDATKWMTEKRIVHATGSSRQYGPRAWDHDSSCTINGNLGKVQFYKVFDAFSAFQEISMWLGGLPQDGPPMIELANEDRIHKHGFDNMSFRTPKTKAG